jgi:hypothetical protein
LVTDPDNDTMNVYFYNASNDRLIDVDINVPNGHRAEVSWTHLAYKTTYTWYAVANDSLLTTKSDIWKFTTRNNPSPPPTISLVKPEEKSLYFRDKRLIRFPKILILGFITITAHAEDDTGIKQVEFYIDGVKKNTALQPTADDTYSWVWNERIWLKGKHTIKVVAVDIDNNKAEVTRDVTIHNFPRLHPTP